MILAYFSHEEISFVLNIRVEDVAEFELSGMKVEG